MGELQRVPEHDGSRRVSANSVALPLRRWKDNSELRSQTRSVARGCPSKQSRLAELKGEEEKEGSVRVAVAQLAALTLPKGAESVRHARSRASSVLSIKRATLSAKDHKDTKVRVVFSGRFRSNLSEIRPSTLY